MNNYSVPLKRLAEEFNLSVAYQATNYDQIRVMVDEVSRPGLPLTGYFEHFEALRVEVLGFVEMTYLDSKTPEERLQIFDRLFAYQIPALVISRGQQPHPECIEMAKKHNITILLAQESTSYIISGLITSLKNALAPRVTRHGVLVEIYGEGILITGESGIGKSETAVELLKRVGGNVDVDCKSKQIAVGTAELLLQFLQILLALSKRIRNVFAAAFGVQLAAFLHARFQIVHLAFHDFHGFRFIHAHKMFTDSYIVGVVEQIRDKFVVAFVGKSLNEHHARIAGSDLDILRFEIETRGRNVVFEPDVALQKALWQEEWFLVCHMIQMVQLF